MKNSLSVWKDDKYHWYTFGFERTDSPGWFIKLGPFSIWYDYYGRGWSFFNFTKLKK